MPQHSCFNCNRAESEVPLIVLQYKEKQIHICPQCLPILIHHPEKLEEKLKKIQHS